MAEEAKRRFRCASLFGREHEDDVFLNWSLRGMDKKLSQVQHIQRTRPCFTYTHVVCRVGVQNGGRENVEYRGKDMCKDRQICSGDVLICEVVSGPSPEMAGNEWTCRGKKNRRVDNLVQLVPMGR